MWDKNEDRAQKIESNIGLVHSCAHRFKGRGIEYEDLFGAGCIGLIKAIDGFDETRGVRLSTYAVPVILGEIKRLFRDGGAVKVSRSIKEKSIRITRTEAEMKVRLGREIKISELATECGMEEEEVVFALTALKPTISLTSDDAQGGIKEMDIRSPSVEEELGDTISLNEAIEKLAAQEQSLIKLRYFKGKTQTETAQILGMTQVQVSRREKKILVALRVQLTV